MPLKSQIGATQFRWLLIKKLKVVDMRHSIEKNRKTMMFTINRSLSVLPSLMIFIK